MRTMAAFFVIVLTACSSDGLPDGVRDLASGGADLAKAVDLAAPRDLAAPKDLAAVDGSEKFPERIVGIWLIGWSGGLNHFTWVRFDANGGGAMLLPRGDMGGWLGYWMCEGPFKWTITSKPDTIQISLPVPCAQSSALTWSSFAPGMGPPGALETASVEENPQMRFLEAYRFPDSQCDMAFTMCKLPF